MFAPVLAVAMASVGTVQFVGHRTDARPIATRALYPAGMADDVRRPGFNGRVWVSRPIIGGIQQGPYAVDTGSPGAEAYGAFGQDATVYARVGLIFVGVSPWDSIDVGGLHRLESARNFWLREQGYTGGVRTLVNDLNLWKPQEDQPAEQHAGSNGLPPPRATITLPAEMPRQYKRLRVDAGPGPVRLPGAGPARISWPDGAPAAAVARTDSSRGLVGGAEEPARVITQAR